MPRVNAIKVRMYRHGFGDCFLLSFFEEDQRVFSMLIDCGIKYQSAKPEDVPIADVIADLHKTLPKNAEGKPILDVLVVTHEHWDHVAYFHPDAPNHFAGFDIRRVWLAWTENPEDDEARIINSRLREGAAALQVAALRLEDAQKAEEQQFQGMSAMKAIVGARETFKAAINDVLGFYGVAASEVTDNGIRYRPDGNISIRTEEAMTNIVTLGQAGGFKYVEPGEMVTEPNVPAGVRVYVLGPPRSRLINKSNPSSGARRETYLGNDHAALAGFMDSLLASAPAPGTPALGVQGPFNDKGRSADEAKGHPYFKKTYFKDAEAYRRIEHSWLDVIGQFSLQLDGAINNTSVVLAIELVDSGKVLLFPGDAQVGSWLSWHELQWKVPRGDGTSATIKAQDLLEKTVLYKVSHHGSHNATLKDKGLELMTHAELVAMIPEKPKCYNGIPYGDLMTKLKERCKGRVLVSADPEHAPEKLNADCPAELSQAEWNAFKGHLVVDRVYVEYTIR